MLYHDGIGFASLSFKGACLSCSVSASVPGARFVVPCFGGRANQAKRTHIKIAFVHSSDFLSLLVSFLFLNSYFFIFYFLNVQKKKKKKKNHSNGRREEEKTKKQ